MQAGSVAVFAATGEPCNHPRGQSENETSGIATRVRLGSAGRRADVGDRETSYITRLERSYRQWSENTQLLLNADSLLPLRLATIGLEPPSRTSSPIVASDSPTYLLASIVNLSLANASTHDAWTRRLILPLMTPSTPNEVCLLELVLLSLHPHAIHRKLIPLPPTVFTKTDTRAPEAARCVRNSSSRTSGSSERAPGAQSCLH
ncbi:hypothetical protein WMY93_029291 [Mugilogobius chulae]|uniref:Uncharacterized protein n=1 Tax=Mugilogobius chulae TaxID=88201 RepID=A0AAW0MQS6_9GOBI